MGITRVMAGIFIVIILAVALFLAGYLQGRESLRPAIADLELANGEYRDAIYRSNTVLGKLRQSLESVRERGIALASGIDGAIERAGRITDRSERIVALVGSIRAIADGLRAINGE